MRDDDEQIICAQLNRTCPLGLMTNIGVREMSFALHPAVYGKNAHYVDTEGVLQIREFS